MSFDGDPTVSLPDTVLRVVNDIKAAKTIATRFPNGRVHTIYMGSLIAPTPDELVFAHIMMKRTHENLRDMKTKGELVSVSVTLGSESYEIMAAVGEYLTSGPKVDSMREMLGKAGIMDKVEEMGMRLLGVWTLIPMEVWDQRPWPQAGTRLV
jgi:hypothetical protein